MKQYAVIMAGGSGTRLWPLSQPDRPKQLLRLFGKQSLLQLSFDRVHRIVEPERTLVIAGLSHRDAIIAELPELPRDNFIGEPVGRDTAAAVALAAAVARQRDTDAIIGVFTADHIIRPVDRFVDCVRAGFRAVEARPDALLTFGIRPTHPHTGLGYVQRGESLGDGLYAVRRFKEKPDAAMAETWLAAGDCYWNSGMFVWSAATILEQIRQRVPDTHSAVTAAASAWGQPAVQQRLAQAYAGLRPISIDYAVLEHAPRVLVQEMAVEWIDVGSWAALREVLPRDANGNASAGAAAGVIRDGKNVIVVSESNHVIAVIGLDDVVVVHSPDATLVCRADAAQAVREIANELANRKPP